MAWKQVHETSIIDEKFFHEMMRYKPAPRVWPSTDNQKEDKNSEKEPRRIAEKPSNFEAKSGC